MLNIARLPAVAEISSLEALRAVSDSQRHKILSLLIREPMTASEVAKRLKMPRTRVYYHLDLLEQHCFIRVVEERQVAAMTERTYRARARRFRVDRRMLAAASSESDVNDAQAAILERAADDLRGRHATTGTGKSEVLVARTFLRLNPAQAAELREALIALVDRFSDAGEEGDSYEMAVALFAGEEEGL